jgi:hypothetical protein
MRGDAIASDFAAIDLTGIIVPMIVVTVDARDYPGKAVGRIVEGAKRLPTNTVVVRDTLDELRAEIPPSFVKLVRHPNDEPQIVEVWI